MFYCFIINKGDVLEINLRGKRKNLWVCFKIVFKIFLVTFEYFKEVS